MGTPQRESPFCSIYLREKDRLFSLEFHRASWSRPFDGTTSQAHRRGPSRLPQAPHPVSGRLEHVFASVLGWILPRGRRGALQIYPGELR